MFSTRSILRWGAADDGDERREIWAIKNGHKQWDGEAGVDTMDDEAGNTISPRIHFLGSGSLGKYIAYNFAGLFFKPPITLNLHRPLLVQEWYDQGATLEVVNISAALHAHKGHESHDSDADSELEISSTITEDVLEDAVMDRVEKNISTEDVDITNHRDNAVIRNSVDVEMVANVSEPLYDGEHVSKSREVEDDQSSIIELLIVTTRCDNTVPALLALRHRLRPWSSICFIQRGLGVIEEVNANVFTDSYNRPSYILGHSTHGLGGHANTFTVVRYRPGSISLAVQPRDVATHSLLLQADPRIERPLVKRLDYMWTSNTRHLARILVSSPELNAAFYHDKTLLKVKLERLAIRAIIDPLCVMFECTPDKLLGNQAATNLMRQLLKEISEIILKLPDLLISQNICRTFSPAALERQVVRTLKKLGGNPNEMVVAINRGQRTEINFINGYFVTRGRELGMACPMNTFLVEMVKAKGAIRRRQEDSVIPFSKQSPRDNVQDRLPRQLVEDEETP